MTDIIRLMIPLVAAILPSLGVLIASKFVTTKINYYKLEDVVTYRLKIVHKIAAVISYIFFVFIVYIYITLYLYAGLEFVTVWPIWIPLAIYIMIIIHIFVIIDIHTSLLMMKVLHIRFLWAERSIFLI